MPRGKKRPTIQQLEDITGAIKLRRWRIVQVLARGIYLSELSDEEIKRLMQVDPAQYMRLLT